MSKTIIHLQGSQATNHRAVARPRQRLLFTYKVLKLVPLETSGGRVKDYYSLTRFSSNALIFFIKNLVKDYYSLTRFSSRLSIRSSAGVVKDYYSLTRFSSCCRAGRSWLWSKTIIHLQGSQAHVQLLPWPSCQRLLFTYKVLKHNVVKKILRRSQRLLFTYKVLKRDDVRQIPFGGQRLLFTYKVLKPHPRTSAAGRVKDYYSLTRFSSPRSGAERSRGVKDYYSLTRFSSQTAAGIDGAQSKTIIHLQGSQAIRVTFFSGVCQRLLFTYKVLKH